MATRANAKRPAKRKSPTHKRAKKNMTKSELKLFANSFPQEIRNLSKKRVQAALVKTEELVDKYRMSVMKANTDRLRMLNFRLKKLEMALDRYARNLKVKNPVKARTQRSLTAQPKMLLKHEYEPREQFMYADRNRQYDKKTKIPRAKASKGREMSKRIAGYMSDRTRKGQVTRDRATSASAK